MKLEDLELLEEIKINNEASKNFLTDDKYMKNEDEYLINKEDLERIKEMGAFIRLTGEDIKYADIRLFIEENKMNKKDIILPETYDSIHISNHDKNIDEIINLKEFEDNTVLITNPEHEAMKYLEEVKNNVFFKEFGDNFELRENIDGWYIKSVDENIFINSEFVIEYLDKYNENKMDNKYENVLEEILEEQKNKAKELNKEFDNTIEKKNDLDLDNEKDKDKDKSDDFEL